jgi:predicted enzyme related to lactoylglutathione lyase
LRVTTAEEIELELVQSRIVTDHVERLAAFYARLLAAPVPLNEYYVEVPAGPVTVGFSKRKFTEYREHQVPCISRRSSTCDSILDFQVDDVDADYERIVELGAVPVMPPTTQPWGSRAMIFADPEGNLVNVFSRAGDR